MSVGQDQVHDAVEKLHQGTPESIVHPQHHVTKAKERMISTNKFSQAFSNLALGSSQIPLTIPNQQVIHGIYVNMTFRGSNAADAVAAMVGYQAIRQLQFRVMGSTLYSLNGRDVWQIVRSMCSTKDQVDELISLAGGPVAVVIGATNLQTTIWLPLQWSRLNSAFTKARYGIDTSIFQNQQIQVFLDLEDSAKIYTVNTGANTTLAFGNFRIYGAEYMDKNQRLVPAHDSFFAYPAHYWQSYQTTSFTPANSSDVISQQLLSFRKGNLISMNGTQKFKLNEITDMQILFNGVSVYQETAIDGRMSGLQHNLMPPQYVAYSQTNRVKEIVFSNLAPRFKQFRFDGGLNLSGQTLTVNLQISNSTNAQKLYVIYVYDALWVYNATQAELVL